MSEESESVPAEEFARWILPRQLRASLWQADWDGPTITEVVSAKLEAGLLVGCAEHIWLKGGAPDQRLQRRQIDSRIWQDVSLEYDAPIWKAGMVKIPRNWAWAVHQMHYATYFGIRFDPQGVAALLPDAPSSIISAIDEDSQEAGKRTGGRRGAPRKDWWDLLWIEMIRRIRAGTLNPKGPTELQQIMLECLAERDIYPGEDTLKKTASNLFRYLQE